MFDVFHRPSNFLHVSVSVHFLLSFNIKITGNPCSCIGYIRLLKKYQYYYRDTSPGIRQPILSSYYPKKTMPI